MRQRSKQFIKDVAKQIVSEFGGKPFPETSFLTIPEYDNIAPEEDWTAGLPRRASRHPNEDWNDVAHGIIISLEQVENYPRNPAERTTPQRNGTTAQKASPPRKKKVLKEWMPT
jgi:hypothetical protein